MGVVFGVGINDSSYSVGGGAYPICPFYSIWKHMLMRAYSAKFHAKHPTYKGVSVCEEWLRFTIFREWMSTKNWEGMEMDKDFRKWGNRVYSPDTCAFIPSRVNCLLHHSQSRKGALPRGVYLAPAAPATPYRARVRKLTGGIRDLGYFSTPEAAHAAWRRGKAVVIFDTLHWWRTSPEVAHSFNSEVSMTLSRFAESLQQLENKELTNV